QWLEWFNDWRKFRLSNRLLSFSESFLKSGMVVVRGEKVVDFLARETVAGQPLKNLWHDILRILLLTKCVPYYFQRFFPARRLERAHFVPPTLLSTGTTLIA